MRARLICRRRRGDEWCRDDEPVMVERQKISDLEILAPRPVGTPNVWRHRAMRVTAAMESGFADTDDTSHDMEETVRSSTGRMPRNNNGVGITLSCRDG